MVGPIPGSAAPPWTARRLARANRSPILYRLRADGSYRTGPWCRSTSRAPLPTAGFMCAGEVGSPEARLSDCMSARHVCGSRAKAEPEIRLEGGRDVPFGCVVTWTGARAVRSQFDAPGVLSPPLLARSGEPLLYQVPMRRTHRWRTQRPPPWNRLAFFVPVGSDHRDLVLVRGRSAT